MNSEQLLQDFTSLPITAQQELISFIDCLKRRHHNVSEPLVQITTLTQPPVNPVLPTPLETLRNFNLVWDKEAVSRSQPAISDAEIEAVCGLYQADCAVSLEQMEEAIMQGAINGRY